VTVVAQLAGKSGLIMASAPAEWLLRADMGFAASFVRRGGRRRLGRWVMNAMAMVAAACGGNWWLARAVAQPTPFGRYFAHRRAAQPTRLS
jgi:hypothetical protein